MRYARLVSPRQFEIAETPDPTPGPGEVVVRVRACGVCASELGPWLEGRPHPPRLLGHEAAGQVWSTGVGVESLPVGMAVTGLFGNAFGEYAVTTPDRLVRVPDGLPYHLAIGEPLACVVSAMRRTPVDFGDHVAIIGLGFMGLVTLQLVRRSGAGRITAIDLRDDARQKALALGAHEAYHPDSVPDSYYSSEITSPMTDGLDVVIEASGSQAALSLASKLVRPHGLLSIVGYHDGGDRSVDMELWNWKGITVVNGHERRLTEKIDSIQRAVRLLESGGFELEPLISHRYELEEINTAFGDLLEKPDGFIKVVVEPWEQCDDRSPIAKR